MAANDLIGINSNAQHDPGSDQRRQCNTLLVALLMNHAVGLRSGSKDIEEKLSGQSNECMAASNMVVCRGHRVLAAGIAGTQPAVVRRSQGECYAAFGVSRSSQMWRFFTRVERILSAYLAVIKAAFEIPCATACSYTT